MAAQGGYWFAGNWWHGNWWESNWFNGDQTVTPGDGEAAAIVWALKRRKRKQPELIQHNPLPPLAVLLEALED